MKFLDRLSKIADKLWAEHPPIEVVPNEKVDKKKAKILNIVLTHVWQNDKKMRDQMEKILMTDWSEFPYEGYEDDYFSVKKCKFKKSVDKK